MKEISLLHPQLHVDTLRKDLVEASKKLADPLACITVPHTKNSSCFLEVDWNSGFGIESSVCVLSCTDVAVDEHGKRYVIHRLSANVSWPAVNRPVTDAVAGIEVYRRATNFAAMLLTTFQDEYWEPLE